MKKEIGIGAAVMVIIGLILCGVVSVLGGPGNMDPIPQVNVDRLGASGSYTPGVYKASDPGGFGGNVVVTIEAAADKITSVIIEGEGETPDKGGAAMDRLAPLMLQAQSAEVDVVSGATITSEAAKRAAAAALAQARGDQSALEQAKVEEEAAQEPLSFTPGTYTGRGTGYNGPVELSVSFDAEKITDIQIVSEQETAQVGTPAYDILFPEMISANGTGMDAVSGATFTSRAIKAAVNDAALQAGVSSELKFTSNKTDVVPGAPIEDTYDIVVVGGGGAGISAAAQAAQDGNTVLVLERNAQVGGNTLVSGGQYQSVMPYLVWDPADPDATTGKGFDGETYDKVKSVQGCIDVLKTIADWSEEPFDEGFYDSHEYVAGDIEELHRHGVHQEYLPVLKELKQEIQAYLDWAEPQLAAGTPENELALFSTLNLHIFQTYYGGLRQSADKQSWIYGNVELVKQFIEDAQEIKPWLTAMGSTFKEDEQQTLIGALWYRENEFIGANVDFDQDGAPEEYGGRWGTYFVAPMNEFLHVHNPTGRNAILPRTTVEKLIVEDGEVTGVTGKMYDGTDVTIHANKGVILATGGYAANIDMVVKENVYWPEEYLTAATKTTNRSSLVGSGLEMAQAAGADVTGLGFTQLMPISWVDNGNLAFGGGTYPIFLNPTTGKRFVDENSERDVLSKAEFENGIEHNGTMGVFMEIYNAKRALPAPPINQLGEEDVEWRYYHRKIGELGALFKELGIEADPEELKAYIEAYDQAVMTGGEFADAPKSIAERTIGDVELKADGSYDPATYDLENADLIVRFMAPSTHHTMGGLVVDVERHVLDKQGKPIPGLYAAGEVTGGIHGGNRRGGNAITEIIVSGRTAAKAADQEK